MPTTPNENVKAFAKRQKPLSATGGEFSPVTSPAVPSEPPATPTAHVGVAAEPPPAAPLEHKFVATFSIREPNTGRIRTQVVEVPHTERPKADQDAAWGAIRKLNPDVKPVDIRRSAGRIVSRPGGKLPEIPIRLGETIRQLFPDKSEFEAARTIGTVIFEGALCDLILRHIRSKSVFAVTLRQPGKTVINFSEQFTTTRLIDELPKILADILGDNAPTLKLYLRRA